jgi:hypothetical protein
MALSRQDSSKVGYKANIGWYKERAFAISDGTITMEEYLAEKNTDFEATPHTPEELIEVLQAIQKKATKLEDKIAFLSDGLKIPVDAVRQPELALAVRNIDSSSNGEFISYATYNKAIKEYEAANSSVTLNYLVNNTTGDASSDSIIVHDAILNSYAASNGMGGQPADNWAQRYLNRWMNNAVSWNEHEYQIQQILNFSDNYLDMFPDPSYIPWSARREVGQEIADAKSLEDLWKNFSSDYAGKIENVKTGLGDLVALKPDKSIEDLTTRSIVYANQFLNKLNQIFDMQWAAHLVCCFMQWGIKLDTKTLKGLRALLQLFSTGLSFDFRDIRNGIKDILNNIMRGILCNQLVGLITQILQRITDPIKEWINSPDEKWNKIFACTPIAELIQTFITQAIDMLQQQLTSLIQNWYKQLEIKNIEQNVKIDVLEKQKICGELAKLLDGIIAATEMAAKCGLQNSPNSEIVQQVISNYGIGDQTKYEFPVEEKPTIYNSFISETPVSTSETSASQGRTVSTTGGSTSSISDSPIATSLAECMKKIPADDVSGVKEWIAKIDSELKRSL